MLRRILAVISSLGMALLLQAMPVSIGGQVVDLKGRPIHGAIVAIIPINNTKNVKIINTNKMGWFQYNCAPGKIGLTVTARGFVPFFNNLNIKTSENISPMTIRLTNGGYTIDGTIISAKNHTLKSLRLGFARVSKDEGDIFFTSANQGRFSINLSAGSYLTNVIIEDQYFNGYRFELSANKTDMNIILKAEGSQAGENVISWIQTNAIPIKTVIAGQGFQDLIQLKTTIGNAEIVGLGEATHGTKEFFQLKHRLLEFLVEEMDFSVFAIEASLPGSYAINEYIKNGTGDPSKLLTKLGFWTWDTKEVLDMIEWMRNYNTTHKKKLKFYGIDMQDWESAYIQVKIWLDQAAPDLRSVLVDLHSRMLGLSKIQSGRPLADNYTKWLVFFEECELLAQQLKSRDKFFKETASYDESIRQIQNIRLMGEYARYMGSPGAGLRDEFMASNIKWILEQEPGSKVVLWAHNTHIAYCKGLLAKGDLMGQHLRSSFGKAYRNFGFAFSEGSFRAYELGESSRGVISFNVTPSAKGTMDAAFKTSRIPLFALDLMKLPKSGPIRKWFDSPQGTWDIGSGFHSSISDQFIQRESITSYYDVLIFINKTTASTPTNKM